MHYKAPIYILLCLGMISCKMTRFIVNKRAEIDDYKKFPSRQIENLSEQTFKFSKIKRNIYLEDVKPAFDKFLADKNTVAFMVIHKDTIKYEKYFNTYSENSIVTSFSISNSITSLLIGCAIDDNYIKSVNEPITNYIPELSKKGFDKVTIKDLLQMTSGLDFNENQSNSFGDVASLYFGKDLRQELLSLTLKNKPEKEFEYLSGNTQLLGFVLERALIEMSISNYLEEVIWTPLQMEYNASWSLDKKDNGLEKTFCCINARARDFAKIGRLYLHKGKWNGKQIVSEKWIKNSTKQDTLNGSAKNYQYQWWIPNSSGDFMAVGTYGQFIFVSPSKDLIIVRFGKDNSNVNWKELYEKIKQKF